jgi:hypothetical protein
VTLAAVISKTMDDLTNGQVFFFDDMSQLGNLFSSLNGKLDLDCITQ